MSTYTLNYALIALQCALHCVWLLQKTGPTRGQTCSDTIHTMALHLLKRDPERSIRPPSCFDPETAIIFPTNRLAVHFVTPCWVGVL